jgi:ribosomal protein S18 acetylase RimI-like enzyme
VLRPLEPEDVPDAVDLVVDAGMFTAEEARFLPDVLAPIADGRSDPEAGRCLVDAVTGPGGRRLDAVAYYRPEDAADGVWDLTMIGVRPHAQRTGTGRRLLSHVEADVAGRGARILAVRTSGTGQYAGARAFYARCGYRDAARVPDWWADGDDLVLFTRRLTT